MVIIKDSKKVELTDDEKEKLRRKYANEFDVDKERINVYTVDEYVEYLEDLLKDGGVSDTIIRYIDFNRMINDMIASGEIFSDTVKLKDKYGNKYDVKIIIDVEW